MHYEHILYILHSRTTHCTAGFRRQLQEYESARARLHWTSTPMIHIVPVLFCFDGDSSFSIAYFFAGILFLNPILHAIMSIRADFVSFLDKYCHY
jgi:hypothetical protein